MSHRTVLAIVVVVLASLLIPCAAMAEPWAHVDGVLQGNSPEGAGRMLLVFGTQLGRAKRFELASLDGVVTVELSVVHRSRTLVLLEMTSAAPPGSYVLFYSAGRHSGVAAIRLAATNPVNPPEPEPTPEPPPQPPPAPPPAPPAPPPPGDYVRVAGGDTITGTVAMATASRALVVSSGVGWGGWGGNQWGGVDSTAWNGIGVAGHGDVGVLGDLDSDGSYGVVGLSSFDHQVGVLGTAFYGANSAGVRGWSQSGGGVEGGSCSGIGVYGYTHVNGPASYYTAHYCGYQSAVGIKAVSKGDDSIALLAEARGATSTALLVNHSGGSGDVAVFQTDGTNCARIALDGTGYFNGGTVSSGADFAESVAVDAPAKDFEPGDVVAIDPASPRRFSLCRTANSALVAGVVSTRPAVVGTVHDMATVGRAALEDEVRVGIVGIVPTKVCDEGGPIRIGDPLVSSSRAGHAMRAPVHPAPGTIIGKALGSLDEGTGKVEVLLTAR